MDKLTKAKYSEWEASLFGACGIAIGLGALFSVYIKEFAPILIIVGGLMHGWGMFRIHKRNR